MRGGTTRLLLHVACGALLAVSSACSSDEPKNTNPSDAGTVPQKPDAAPPDAGPTTCVAQQPGSPHLATVPVLYLRRVNPIPETTESLAKGQLLFTQECVRCHGESGKGDGGDGASLDPKPADFTLRSHTDGYLFWRVAEGGQGDPDCSAMPSFKSRFSEDDRWTLVRHVQRFSKPDGGPGS